MNKKKVDAFKEAFEKATVSRESASTSDLSGEWAPLDIDDYGRLVFTNEDGASVAFSPRQLKSIAGFKLDNEAISQELEIKSEKTEEHPVTAYAGWAKAKKALDALKQEDDNTEATKVIFDKFNSNKGQLIDAALFIYKHKSVA